MFDKLNSEEQMEGAESVVKVSKNKIFHQTRSITTHDSGVLPRVVQRGHVRPALRQRGHEQVAALRGPHGPGLGHHQRH